MKKIVVLGLLATAFLTTSGCDGGRDPVSLTPAEQMLVDDMVELYRLRILRATDPGAAEQLREDLRLHYDDAGLQRQLEAMGAEPERGQQLLQAVHDSLEVMRPRLFPDGQG